MLSKGKIVLFVVTIIKDIVYRILRIKQNKFAYSHASIREEIGLKNNPHSNKNGLSLILMNKDGYDGSRNRRPRKGSGKSQTFKKSERVIGPRESDPFSLNNYDEAYLQASAHSKEAGILSPRLKAIGIVVSVIILLVLAIGNYLNNKNPLLPIINNPVNPFTINFLDKNNARLYGLSNQTDGGFQVKNTAPILFDALLALHGVLEIKAGNPNPRFARDFPATLDSMGGASPQSNQYTDKNSDASSCIIYSSLSEFGRTSCAYSYPYFLINNFVNAVASQDRSIVTSFINSSTTIKNYLLTRWVETNVDIESFLNVYFNYVYYGYYTLGLNSVSTRLFDVTSRDLKTYQAIIIMKSIYDNNKHLYPSVEISYEDIIQLMIVNGAIYATEKDEIMEKINEFHNKKLYQIAISPYLDYMFSEAYEYYTKVPVANVKTTFISSVQNTALSATISQMKKSKAPNATVVISNKGDLLATFVLGLDEEGNPIYYKEYPKVIRTYNAIKPIVYLSLLENYKDTTSVLLDSRYQNLIFSNFRKRMAENFAVADASETIRANRIPIELLTQTNLDVVPSNIRALFSNKLSQIETEYISSLNVDRYNKIFAELEFSTKINSVDDILLGNVYVSFKDLARFYDALSQNGLFHNLRVVELVNNDVKYPDPVTNLSLSPQFVDIMESLFLNTLQSKGSTTSYNTILDFNTAFAISPSYSIAIWMGDMDNPDAVEDYTDNVQAILLELTSLLQ